MTVRSERLQGQPPQGDREARDWVVLSGGWTDVGAERLSGLMGGSAFTSCLGVPLVPAGRTSGALKSRFWQQGRRDVSSRAVILLRQEVSRKIIGCSNDSSTQENTSAQTKVQSGSLGRDSGFKTTRLSEIRELFGRINAREQADHSSTYSQRSWVYLVVLCSLI